MDNVEVRYSVKLSFEEVKMPLFEDILILGKNSPQGKTACSMAFELLAPGCFTLVETDDDRTDAIFINKKLLSKVPKEQIVSILKNKVFQLIAEGEILKVDFKICGSVIL